MAKYTTLIVGAHFRPPAKQVLAVLAAGAALRLEEENDNPYDAEAIKVFVSTDEIPPNQYKTLDEELPNAGLTLEQLMSTGPVWLGYVPASGGKPLAKAKLAEPELIGNHEVRELGFTILGQQAEGCRATLGFGLDGSPRLHLEVD